MDTAIIKLNPLADAIGPTTQHHDLLPIRRACLTLLFIGGVLSPLLANLYLHPLDADLTSAGYRIVRNADDFVVLCRTRKEIHPAFLDSCLDLLRCY